MFHNEHFKLISGTADVNHFLFQKNNKIYNIYNREASPFDLLMLYII